MRNKLFLFSLLLFLNIVFRATASIAEVESRKINIAYSSLTAGYTPLWIAVERELGRKYD
jgi:hypothetical protein